MMEYIAVSFYLNRYTKNRKTAGKRRSNMILSPSKLDLILTNKNKNCQAKYAACANDEI